MARPRASVPESSSSGYAHRVTDALANVYRATLLTVLTCVLLATAIFIVGPVLGLRHAHIEWVASHDLVWLLTLIPLVIFHLAIRIPRRRGDAATSSGA